MTDVDAVYLVNQAIWVAMVMAGPLVVSAMVIGTIIAFFQALTQVQEMTLTFVPKILAAFFIIMLSGTYAGNVLMAFTEEVYSHIATNAN